MNATADTIQDRENMIKRLNKFILAKILGIRLRPVVAVLLGGFAGLSLNSTILPMAVSYLGLSDDFSARWALGGYAVYSFMVWAVGGWAARKTGNTMAGGVILGVVGLVSGALLAGGAFGAGMQPLTIGAVTGLVYGTIGGMLITNALRDIPQSAECCKAEPSSSGKEKGAPKSDGKTKTHKKTAFRAFRFFK